MEDAKWFSLIDSDDSENEDMLHQQYNSINDCSNERLENDDNDINDEKKIVENKKKKKSDVIATILQLQLHVKAMEKEKKSVFYKKNGLKSGIGQYKELENIDCGYIEKLQEDRKDLAVSIEKISQKVEKFKHEKSNIHKSKNYIQKLKEIMEDIENQVIQFKEKQRLIYEEICLAETHLSKDIETCNNKFENWSKLKLPIHNESNSNALNKKDSSPPPKELQEFEDFVKATGGYRGGWDDIDHNTFLKLRKQIKNDKKLLTEAANDIPTQSREEINHHIEWYKEFIILQDRKREAIRQWKNKKEDEKRYTLHYTEDELLKQEKKKKHKEKVYAKERESRLHQLEDWKKSKEKEKMEQEKYEQEMNEKKKLKEISEERRKCELKLMVEEYKIRKKEEDEILIESMKPKHEKKVLTDEELFRIKERNDKLLASKREHHLMKEYEIEERIRREEKLKEKVAVNVSRDPNRLYQLTEGWKCRKVDKSNDKQAFSAGTHVRMIPHRSVPTWRQGMH